MQAYSEEIEDDFLEGFSKISFVALWDYLPRGTSCTYDARADEYPTSKRLGHTTFRVEGAPAPKKNRSKLNFIYVAAPNPCKNRLDVLSGMAKPPTATTQEADPHPIAAEQDTASAPMDEEAFLRELTEGMQGLMSELGGLQGLDMAEPALEKIFESMKFPGPSEPVDSSTSAPVNPTASFQDRIKETMSKMQDSSAKVNEESKVEDMDTLMAEMMAQMEQLTQTGDFESVIENMMESLLSKDILHEPLKELAAKYPEYLTRHQSTLSPDDHAKYTQQLALIQDILVIYESGTHDDQSKRVIDLLTQVQELGQPPAELLQELAPGMDMDAAGLSMFGDPDNKCNVM